jgi:hypothetical protein
MKQSKFKQNMKEAIKTNWIYKCPSCKMFGGLKRFASMCYQVKQQVQTQ